MVNGEARRFLGLDVGEKRIGVAISSPGGVLALPLTTITFSNTGEALKAIQDIVVREDIGKVIVGLPKSLSGDLGPQAVRVQEFASILGQSLSIPIEFQDERFSTFSVDRMMRHAGTRREKRKERRDAEAAAYILQGYLDGKDSKLERLED